MLSLSFEMLNISSSVPDNPGKIKKAWSVIDLDVSNICDYYLKITLSACILRTDYRRSVWNALFNMHRSFQQSSTLSSTSSSVALSPVCLYAIFPNLLPFLTGLTGIKCNFFVIMIGSTPKLSDTWTQIVRRCHQVQQAALCLDSSLSSA